MEIKPKQFAGLNMPEKHILILDDLITRQAQLSKHLAGLFGDLNTNNVITSCVPDANVGREIVKAFKIDLILLDYAMPSGCGEDFIIWIKKEYPKIPVITTSDIEEYNDILFKKGADYKCQKQDLLLGKHDDLIKGIIEK